MSPDPSTSLALIGCNFVPESFNKADEIPDTLALLKAGDAKACSADDVKDLVKNLIRPDYVENSVRVNQVYAKLRIEMSAIVMIGKNQEVESVDCNSTISISYPDRGQIGPTSITYSVYPSAEDSDKIVVGLTDIGDVQEQLDALIAIPLTEAQVNDAIAKQRLNQAVPAPSDSPMDQDSEEATNAEAVADDAAATKARMHDLVATITAQVKPCYVMPAGADNRDIVSILKLQFNRNGSLAGTPSVIDHRGVTSTNQDYVQQMDDAAVRAVQRCAPLKLPPDLYAGGWENIEFSLGPDTLE